MKRLTLGLLAVLATTTTGCTTTALERHTVAQAESISDLRYREVMENLAMIAANPEILPAYSSIYAGTSDVSDTASVSSATQITRTFKTLAGKTLPVTTTNLGQENLDVNLQRQVKQVWTLDAMVAPEKLGAFRAACRWVIYGANTLDPESRALLSTWTTGMPPGFYFEVDCKLANLPACWLHWGKHCAETTKARYKAHCNDVWVWVNADGVDGLSRFELIVQEIARDKVDSLYAGLGSPRSFVITLDKNSFKDPNFYANLLKTWHLDDGQLKITATVKVDKDGYLIVDAGGKSAKVLLSRLDYTSTGNAKLRSQIQAANSSH